MSCRSRWSRSSACRMRLDASERARHEPIAVVGMACRLPGGLQDTQAYWKALTEGLDLVGEVPADRWDVDAYYDPDPNAMGKARTKAGGFLEDIDGFEPAFFGISPREAAGLDPQQRLLLEVGWEALEDARHRARQPGRQPDRRVRRHHVDGLLAAHRRRRSSAQRHLSGHRHRARTPPPGDCRSRSACRARAWPSTPRARRRSSPSTRPARACATGRATSRWPAA